MIPTFGYHLGIKGRATIMGVYLQRRAGVWYYMRRVPGDVAHADRRVYAKATTMIRVADDPNAVAAGPVAVAINAEVEAYWASIRNGQGANPKGRVEAARYLAQRRGFEYRPAAALAAGPLDEILKRLDALERHDVVDDRDEVEALLGGAKPDVISVSDLFSQFEDIMRASLTDMSAAQLEKWPAPYERAIETFIAVVGDKPITDITRDDALDFRKHWQNRILKGDVKIYTANRQIGSLNRMMTAVIDHRRLNITSPFEGTRIPGQHREEEQRVAYAPAYIQERLLAPGALAGLNAEARHVLYLVTETGLRLSEAVNLTRDTIKLDCTVPHILVRPDGRRLKAAGSKREIPLVGVALEAMKLNRDGFPRYRDKSASLSATIGKFLAENKLRPTGEETAYSLRHSFEDRLNAVEAPEKMVALLMGHKLSRPKYGSGFALDHVQGWLEKIAFKPPASI